MAAWESGSSGGSGGENFTDLSSVPARAPLASVEVRAGRVVDAIRSSYRRGSGVVSAPWHGGSGGSLKTLRLQEGEFIRRVRGTYATVVDSLIIDTNMRTAALRTGGSGGQSSFVYEAGRGLEIAGFVGDEGAVIDALGVVYRRRDSGGDAPIFRSGPVGGEGGRAFSDTTLLRPDRELALVRVFADRFVDSIQLYYRSAAGRLVAGPKRGGDGGDMHELALEPGEFITSVSGRRGSLVDRIVIDTNRREEALVAGYNLRPFEPRSPFNTTYRYNAPAGTAIDGFFGRSGTVIDALGVIQRVRRGR